MARKKLPKLHTFTVNIKAHNFVRTPLLQCAEAVARPKSVTVDFKNSDSDPRQFEKVSISCEDADTAGAIKNKLSAYQSNTWKFYSSKIVLPKINDLTEWYITEALTSISRRYGGLMSLFTHSSAGGGCEAQIHFPTSEIRDAFAACKFITNLQNTEKLASYAFKLDPEVRTMAETVIHMVLDGAYELQSRIQVLKRTSPPSDELTFLATDKEAAGQFAEILRDRDPAVKPIPLRHVPDVAAGALAGTRSTMMHSINYLGSFSNG